MHKIYENVSLGEDVKIGEYCVIGMPPSGSSDGELALRIGDNAIIRPLSVIYSGSEIGDNFQTGTHVYVREGNKIGDNVKIGSGAKIEHGHTIGNNVSIHTACILGEFSTIEDNAWIGPDTIFLNDLHPPCAHHRDGKPCVGAPIIRRNAKIGARCTILPGVEIGENSLIAAGSLVTKNVPQNCVVMGSPAKVVKKIEELKCIQGYFKRPYEWEDEQN
ncbi:acetyltransferase [Candidatus Woesearchaeota archaeon]|nr:acetyltransferase [Candidatus Woesearchaeota archaeon]